MKWILSSLFLILTVLVSEGALSSPRSPGYPDRNREVYGWWRTERPIVEDPFVVSHGDMYIDHNSIYYRATCAYSNGPVLTPEVRSPIHMANGFFNILQNRYDEDNWGRYGCSAQLSAGIVEYQADFSGRLVLFNRATGWRLYLIRR